LCWKRDSTTVRYVFQLMLILQLFTNIVRFTCSKKISASEGKTNSFLFSRFKRNKKTHCFHELF